jgi:hypothetical protein
LAPPSYANDERATIVLLASFEMWGLAFSHLDKDDGRYVERISATFKGLFY